MNDRSLIEAANEAADGITRISVWLITVGGDGRTPIQRNRDGYNGHPKAACYSTSSDTAPSAPESDDDGWRRAISDPTGEAAIRVDRAAQSRKRVERHLRSLENIRRQLENELVTWGEPREATEYDRRMAERDNIKPEPGCESCARCGRWSPIHARGVCQSCGKWERDFGEWPPEAYVEAVETGDQTTTRRLRSDAMRKAGAA